MGFTQKSNLFLLLFFTVVKRSIRTACRRRTRTFSGLAFCDNACQSRSLDCCCEARGKRFRHKDELALLLGLGKVYGEPLLRNFKPTLVRHWFFASGFIDALVVFAVLGEMRLGNVALLVLVVVNVSIYAHVGTHTFYPLLALKRRVVFPEFLLTLCRLDYKCLCRLKVCRNFFESGVAIGNRADKFLLLLSELGERFVGGRHVESLLKVWLLVTALLKVSKK
jgi:hypothetical protein